MTAPLSYRDLAKRFNIGTRRARHLLRRMNHLCDGRDMWTTEAWLAEWAASQAIPGRDWPQLNRDREPIDEDVVQRAIELIGMMADRGIIHVHDTGTKPKEEGPALSLISKARADKIQP